MMGYLGGDWRGLMGVSTSDAAPKVGRYLGGMGGLMGYPPRDGEVFGGDCRGDGVPPRDGEVFGGIGRHVQGWGSPRQALFWGRHLAGGYSPSTRSCQGLEDVCGSLPTPETTKVWGFEVCMGVRVRPGAR